MGLETAPQTPLGRIDPGSIIGLPEPVVTPSAVSALSDAFRKGQISADDIISRYGELAKTKKKSDLQTLEEGMSPEAVQLRQTTTSTQQSQQELLGQAAEAGQVNLAQQQEIKRLGPFGEMAVETFMRLRNEAAITELPVKDGKTDWATIAEWGARLGAQKMKKDEAFARLKDPKRQVGVSNGSSVSMLYDSFGAFVSPEAEKELNDTMRRPLSVTGAGWENLKPGTVMSPAVVSPRTATNDNEYRRQLVDSGVMDMNMATSISPAEAKRRFEIEFPAPAVAPLVQQNQGFSAGQTVSGVGVATGVPVTSGLKAPTEAQQRAQLALARFGQSNDMLAALREAGYDPTTTLSWINSLLPEIVKSGDRKVYDAATSAWAQGLLRLESGAAIAPREKTWYERSFFPQVNDPPALVAQKEMMRSNLEKMVAEMAQAGGVISPESAAQTQRIYEHAQSLSGVVAGAAVAAPSSPVITLKSGKKVQFDEATGQYKPVP